MTIHIEDLKFQCIIGILDFERTTPQDVIINLEIKYDFQTKFINYADVSNFIQSTMTEKKFMLIEDAINYFIFHLKENFLQINELYLKITKPSILAECSVSVSHSAKY